MAGLKFEMAPPGYKLMPSFARLQFHQALLILVPRDLRRPPWTSNRITWELWKYELSGPSPELLNEKSVFGMVSTWFLSNWKLAKHLYGLRLPLHTFSPTVVCRPVFFWPLSLFTAFYLACYQQSCHLDSQLSYFIASPKVMPFTRGGTTIKEEGGLSLSLSTGA